MEKSDIIYIKIDSLERPRKDNAIPQNKIDRALDEIAHPMPDITVDFSLVDEPLRITQGNMRFMAAIQTNSGVRVREEGTDKVWVARLNKSTGDVEFTPEIPEEKSSPKSKPRRP